MPNADLVLSGEPSHLLKISEVEGILAYEILEDDFLRLSLNILWEF